MKADAHQQERVSKGVAAETRSLIQKLRLLLAIFVMIYSFFFFFSPSYPFDSYSYLRNTIFIEMWAQLEARRGMLS